MQTAYHPAWGTPVNYEFVPMPDSADGQVGMTIADAVRLINEDSKDPLIQQVAQECLALGGGDPVVGVWKHVKHYMRFAQDFDVAQMLNIQDARLRDVVEVIIRPADQARLIKTRGIGIGDCDCFEVYALCLLTALGVPCVLVTVSANDERPREFSHVYGAAYIKDANSWTSPSGGIDRIPLDFSHGPHPGWECPNLGRIKEWPVCRSGVLGLVEMLAVAGATASIWMAWQYWGGVH